MRIFWDSRFLRSNSTCKAELRVKNSTSKTVFTLLRPLMWATYLLICIMGTSLFYYWLLGLSTSFLSRSPTPAQRSFCTSPLISSLSFSPHNNSKFNTHIFKPYAKSQSLHSQHITLHPTSKRKEKPSWHEFPQLSVSVCECLYTHRLPEPACLGSHGTMHPSHFTKRVSLTVLEASTSPQICSIHYSRSLWLSPQHIKYSHLSHYSKQTNLQGPCVLMIHHSLLKSILHPRLPRGVRPGEADHPRLSLKRLCPLDSGYLCPPGGTSKRPEGSISLPSPFHSHGTSLTPLPPSRCPGRPLNGTSFLMPLWLVLFKSVHTSIQSFFIKRYSVELFVWAVFLLGLGVIYLTSSSSCFPFLPSHASSKGGLNSPSSSLSLIYPSA